MNRKLFFRSVLITFLLFFAFVTHGQSRQDSLFVVLKSSANDTNKVKTLNELSTYYSVSD